MGVVSMGHKTPLMMIEGGIISNNVSFKDLLISFLAMVDHSTRYLASYLIFIISSLTYSFKCVY